MRPHLVLAFLCLAAALGAAPALAAPPFPLLGEPWEEGILDGIREQEQGLKERTPQALLVEAKSRAARRADPAATVVRQYLLARAYGLVGDQASARATYAEVLRLAPRCYMAWRDLGILDARRTPPDPAGAERAFRQALTLNPSYPDALRALTLLLLEAKREGEALPFLVRITELEPADARARALLVRALEHLKRFPEAKQQIDLLRRKDPTSPAYRDLEAEWHLLQGDAARARDLYRQLAADLPAEPAPLVGYLKALDALGTTTGRRDPEEYLWAIERLVRLERDPAQRQRLAETRDAIRADLARAEQAVPGQPQGPPTDAQLLQVLRGPKEEGRVAVLRYVFAQDKPPSAEVLRAVMERLDASREPSAVARQWALRVLGRFGGFGLVGLVRHALVDADPSVRVTAADALVTLAEQDAVARGAAILVLAPLAAGADPTLAAVARMAVLQLAPGELPGSPETEEARRAAFATWWGGPVAVEARLRALEGFPRLKDRLPEGVLLPYLRDPDLAVAAAAYRALAASLPASANGARAAWVAAFPRPAEGELTAGNRATAVARIESWASARPR